MKNLSTTAILNDRLNNLNLEYTRTQDKLNTIAEQLYDRDYLLDTLMSDNRVKQRYTLNLLHNMFEDNEVEVANTIVKDMANNIIKFGTISYNDFKGYVEEHIEDYYNNDLDIMLEPLFILDNHYQEFQYKVFSLHKEIEGIKRALEVL